MIVLHFLAVVAGAGLVWCVAGIVCDVRRERRRLREMAAAARQNREGGGAEP